MYSLIGPQYTSSFWKFVEEEINETNKESLWTLLKMPGYTRALLLSLFALVLQQASGVIVMICYLEPILDMINYISIDRTTAAVIIGCGNLPSILLSPPMARYLGTKLTLVICSTAMSVVMIGFTVFENFDFKGYDMTSFDFVPILTLFLYNIFFCTGLGPLTWSVVAEISPPKIKGFVCFFSSTVCWLAAFVLLLVFHPAWSAVGPTPVFGFFSACLVIGTILVQITLPDTKGLSLHQVQQVIAGKKVNIKQDIKEKHESQQV